MSTDGVTRNSLNSYHLVEPNFFVYVKFLSHYISHKAMEQQVFKAIFIYRIRWPYYMDTVLLPNTIPLFWFRIMDRTSERNFIRRYEVPSEAPPKGRGQNRAGGGCICGHGEGGDSWNSLWSPGLLGFPMLSPSLQAHMAQIQYDYSIDHYSVDTVDTVIWKTTHTSKFP